VRGEREDATEETTVVISRRDFDAAIFDLDGVLTLRACTPRFGKSCSIISFPGTQSPRAANSTPLISAATILLTSTVDLATTVFALFWHRGA
jgi:hypothetical protein